MPDAITTGIAKRITRSFDVNFIDLNPEEQHTFYTAAKIIQDIRDLNRKEWAELLKSFGHASRTPPLSGERARSSVAQPDQ